MSDRLRRSHLLLMAIILLAAVLRFYCLEDQSLWYDEGFSISLAKLPWSGTIAWTAQDVHPPLYYFLLHLWIRLCGDSALAVRAFSALAGIATVPLIYLLGKRILSDDVGLIAALLATLFPPYLYYSREARMYTLLTFLSLLSSYILLCITDRRCKKGKRAALWAVYLLTSLTAAYVHYFALLILAVHAIYFVAWWLREGRPLDFGRQTVAVAVLGALGYLPWAPVLVDRYLYDTGYWQGRMPFLMALRRVLVSISVGETMAEPVAWYMMVSYIVLLSASALLLFRYMRKGSTWDPVQPLSFLWLYLLLPVGLIAFLYSRKPRVSPRHSMLVSPPFLLLISTAIVALWSRGSIRRRELSALLAHCLAVGAACFVLATTSYADYSLFFAPGLRKPDFRGAVRCVCQECKTNEAIVLISGHMFPIFDYYCPGRERYPIPDDPVLRVDDMVSLNVMEKLQQITAGKAGVWLVLWQDNVVDPQHIVPDLLLRQGTEVLVPRSFYGIGLRHIQLSPGARFVWESAVRFPVNARWERGITLLEARVNKQAFHHGEDVQLTLYWRTDTAVPESYTVFAHVQHGEARTQHDGLPVSGARPTNTWRPGEVIEDRHLIEIPSWLPPGEYDLQVGLYNLAAEGLPRLGVIDEAGREIDTRVILGTLHVLPDGHYIYITEQAKE